MKAVDDGAKLLFTPAWYRRAQTDPRLFGSTFKKYESRLKRMRPELSPALSRFTDYTFHDCALTQALWLANSRIELHLHGHRKSRSTGGAVKGHHVIMMQGVSDTNLRPRDIGGWWLYEEVAVTDGQMRFAALLGEPTGVIWFRFSDVKVSVAK